MVFGGIKKWWRKIKLMHLSHRVFFEYEENKVLMSEKLDRKACFYNRDLYHRTVLFFPFMIHYRRGKGVRRLDVITDRGAFLDMWRFLEDVYGKNSNTAKERLCEHYKREDSRVKDSFISDMEFFVKDDNYSYIYQSLKEIRETIKRFKEQAEHEKMLQLKKFRMEQQSKITSAIAHGDFQLTGHKKAECPSCNNKVLIDERGENYIICSSCEKEMIAYEHEDEIILEELNEALELEEI